MSTPEQERSPASLAMRRAGRACLPPVLLHDLVPDPEAVRALARRSGPYVFPERPGGFIWPTWHTQWAVDGRLLVDEAGPLLHLDAFAEAATQMCGGGTVVAEGLYVNLGTPWMAQPVMHTDLPLFRGIDKNDVPGWFLQAMGASRLFEAERINSMTAVAWFFAGENGGFSCWPDGPGGSPLQQTDMWNTAIVGDNDFMYHRVERIGAEGTTSPDGMTQNTTLDHDGFAWVVADGGTTLGRFDDADVRLSISWKATIDDGSTASVNIEDVFGRFASELADDMEAASVAELFDEASRVQLMARWPGFVPVQR